MALLRAYMTMTKTERCLKVHRHNQHTKAIFSMLGNHGAGVLVGTVVWKQMMASAPIPTVTEDTIPKKRSMDAIISKHLLMLENSLQVLNIGNPQYICRKKKPEYSCG